MKKINVIVVAGPTASGKTRLAIDIAKAVDGEIVSADSMQIYKYMDIGTAKPTAAERAECRHHLIDFVEPDAEFSVADYTLLAHETIEEINRKNKTAILCGGTGLYINSVINDVEFGEMDTDYELRNELQRKAEREGSEALLEELKEFDPVSAARLHPNNLRRIIRAIEFYRGTGVAMSEHQEQTKQKESRYNPTMFCINRPRELLYDRINKRVDIMLDEGLCAEVEMLISRGFTRELNSMKGIGYKELMSHYAGECSLAEAVAAIKQGSRRYAKRQMTWFRRDERIIMLESDNAAEAALNYIMQK